MKLTMELIDALSDRYYYIDTCEDYGEPGYSKTNENNWLLFSDWNTFPKHVMNFLEKHADMEWCDEWLFGEDNRKAYRCIHNSYNWKAYYWEFNGEIVGGDELEESEDLQDEYLESIINNHQQVNIFDFIDLEKRGFEKVNEDEFENGWYDRHDDPCKILDSALNKHWDDEFIFSNLSTEQFRINFDLYRRKYKEGA